jgi:hypothetical protein
VGLLLVASGNQFSFPLEGITTVSPGKYSKPGSSKDALLFCPSTY